jgi:hypothetical protein
VSQSIQEGIGLQQLGTLLTAIAMVTVSALGLTGGITIGSWFAFGLLLIAILAAYSLGKQRARLQYQNNHP